VQRPFTFVGVVPALDAFSDMAAELKQQAETAARDAGRSMATARPTDAAA
jgi:FMN-dependent NADH-azoreductase